MKNSKRRIPRRVFQQRYHSDFQISTICKNFNNSHIYNIRFLDYFKLKLLTKDFRGKNKGKKYS
jgi:hypothetical protein